jgi:MerR family Zn(II)-responsive transcriptional regulator of zntA
MQLTACAKQAGVTADTLRHYLRVGLVRPEGQSANGYRRFSERTVARLRFIRAALSLGFTLADAAEMIVLSEQGGLPCPRARSLLVDRIAQQQPRIDAMAELYRRMKRALKDWQTMPDGVPDGHAVCGLIEGVAGRLPRATGSKSSSQRPPRNV